MGLSKFGVPRKFSAVSGITRSVGVSLCSLQQGQPVQLPVTGHIEGWLGGQCICGIPPTGDENQRVGS